MLLSCLRRNRVDNTVAQHSEQDPSDWLNKTEILAIGAVG